MSDLVVIGFDDENTAFEMRAKLATLQKEYLIDKFLRFCADGFMKTRIEA